MSELSPVMYIRALSFDKHDKSSHKAFPCLEKALSLEFSPILEAYLVRRGGQATIITHLSPGPGRAEGSCGTCGRSPVSAGGW